VSIGFDVENLRDVGLKNFWEKEKIFWIMTWWFLMGCSDCSNGPELLLWCLFYLLLLGSLFFNFALLLLGSIFFNFGLLLLLIFFFLVFFLPFFVQDFKG